MTIPKNERICQFCEHCNIREAGVGYSEYTPGSEFEMWCYKKHWKFDAYRTSESLFAKIILTARNCKDFIINKRIIEEVFNEKNTD